MIRIYKDIPDPGGKSFPAICCCGQGETCQWCIGSTPRIFPLTIAGVITHDIPSSSGEVGDLWCGEWNGQYDLVQEIASTCFWQYWWKTPLFDWTEQVHGTGFWNGLLAQINDTDVPEGHVRVRVEPVINQFPEEPIFNAYIAVFQKVYEAEAINCHDIGDIPLIYTEPGGGDACDWTNATCSHP
jgi:hypothetical protein